MNTDASTFFRKKSVRIPAAIFATLLWGIAFPLIKKGYATFGIENSDTFTLLLYAGLRFFVAGIISFMIPVCTSKQKVRIPRSVIPGILLFGLVQTFGQNFFQFIGLANTTGSAGTMIAQTNVFLLVFLSPLFFKDDKITARRIIGSIIGFSGIFVLNIKDGFSFSFSPIGEGFMVLSSIMGAFGFIVGKKVTANQNVAVMTGAQQTLAGLALMILGISLGGKIPKVTPAGVFVLFILILTAVGANLIWNTLLKYNPISDISIFKFATPVFGFIFSGILLGEEIFKLNNIAALILITVGIITANYRRNNNENHN